LITFLSNGGVHLCVERLGHGPHNVVLLHGWISSRRMWHDVAQRLDGERFTLHLLDFRGCGLSDRPSTGHYLEGYASDALALMSSLQGEVTLAGHSMGGRIAQYVACMAPPNLKRLILVAPGAPSGTRVSKRRILLATQAFGSRDKIEAFQRAAMSADVDPQAMRRIVDDALVAQREVWFGDPDPAPSVDFSDRLAAMVIPALCIAGANDPLAPPMRVRSDVAQRISGALFVTLRNAGHNLPIEAPNEISSAITRFTVTT